MPQQAKNQPSQSKGSNIFRWFGFIIILMLVSMVIVNVTAPREVIEEVAFSDVIARANDENGDIKKITVQGNELKITLKGKDYATQRSRKDGSGTLYEQGLVNQCAELEGNQLAECQAKYPVIEFEEVSSFWDYALDIAIIAVPVIIIIFFFGSMMRQAQSMNNQNMGFGKAKAKLYGPDKKKVTFKDVAGNEAAKQDLAEIVDFLKEPKKYEKLGAKIPRGVLLAGDPGTGKTLMARAVAGEASVPFFSISGSEFAEMFVGVGASRVRDLFSKAKKNAPSIIFIDEIDAVAHKRDARGGAGREDEQTLNQILVEMDGFDNDSGVIVIAATNRVDMLDKALLRPGRFDRHVNVTLPERKDRLEILKVHFKNKPVTKDVDLEALAAKTAGSRRCNCWSGIGIIRP